MKVVSVINYKGGVGKTTVTANLAAGLAKKGKRVLLLDVDPQASLTFSFINEKDWKKYCKESSTIKEYFDAVVKGNNPPSLENFLIKPKGVNDKIKQLDSDGFIDLIPSHLDLIGVDLELATLLGGASMKQSKDNYFKVHNGLREFIVKNTYKKYDIVLIDCPPNFNIVTKNALVASDHVLIPAKPDYLSTLGIDYLQRNITDLTKEFNAYTDLQTYTKPI